MVMRFFNFGRENLLFLAIFLDLAGDCIDFMVAFGNQRQQQRERDRQKKDKRSKVDELERRSHELEREVELLRRQIDELSRSKEDH